MQGGAFFDEEFDGTIYFDVTVENEELLAIFRFPGSSEIPENGSISGPAPKFWSF